MIQGGGLYDYLQGIQAYLAPPIFVVFLAFYEEIKWPRMPRHVLTGFAMGLFRLAVDTPVKLMGTTYAEGSFFSRQQYFLQYYSVLITGSLRHRVYSGQLCNEEAGLFEEWPYLFYTDTEEQRATRST